MVLETLLLLLPCTLSNAAQISDTVFFTWYVHLCLPKPLETLLKFAFHPFFLKKKLNQKDSSFEHFHHPLSSLFFFLFPHACSLLNSAFPPGLPNVSVTADHQSGGSAGHFRAPRGSRLTQRLQLDPHPPNFGSWAPLMSCPRQAESHLAKPQKHFQLQTAWCSPQRETRPKVEELIRSHHITMRTYSSLIAEQSSFISCFWQKYLWDVYTCSDLAGADMQKHTSPEVDGHQSLWIYLERVLGFIRGLYRITFFFFTRWKFTTVYEKFYSSALESKSSITIKNNIQSDQWHSCKCT